MSEEKNWYVPHKVVPLGDGTFKIIPQKPILRASVVFTSKATGVRPRILHRLADAGIIRRGQTAANRFLFYPAEVERLIRETERNPGYWRELQRKMVIDDPLKEAVDPPEDP